MASKKNGTRATDKRKREIEARFERWREAFDHLQTERDARVVSRLLEAQEQFARWASESKSALEQEVTRALTHLLGAAANGDLAELRKLAEAASVYRERYRRLPTAVHPHAWILEHRPSIGSKSLGWRKNYELPDRREFLAETLTILELRETSQGGLITPLRWPGYGSTDVAGLVQFSVAWVRHYWLALETSFQRPTANELEQAIAPRVKRAWNAGRSPMGMLEAILQGALRAYGEPKPSTIVQRWTRGLK